MAVGEFANECLAVRSAGHSFFDNSMKNAEAFTEGAHLGSSCSSKALIEGAHQKGMSAFAQSLQNREGAHEKQGAHATFYFSEFIGVTVHGLKKWDRHSFPEYSKDSRSIHS